MKKESVFFSCLPRVATTGSMLEMGVEGGKCCSDAWVSIVTVILEHCKTLPVPLLAILGILE